MGRRALRKVDPSLDLSNYLYTVDELPSPLCSGQLFGRDAALEIEIGSGKGLFLCSAAAAHPEMDYLGIEIAKKYAQFAAAELAKHELTNGKVVAGDALRVFAELVPSDTLAGVHVYFPDPWWKKRHKKRRVMQDALVKDIERTLKPGCTLHFWTDVQEYFHSALEVLAEHTTLEGPFDVPESDPEHDLDYRTHFERRMRMHDLPIYRAEFRKKTT